MRRPIWTAYSGLRGFIGVASTSRFAEAGGYSESSGLYALSSFFGFRLGVAADFA